MRSIKSMRNMLISMLVNLVIAVIGFVAQKVFIYTLGDEYLGINGLFSNIISMLAIAELGVGTAIIYNMYKPIAEDDRETIKSLLLYYKKCYRIIAIFVLLIGLLIIPFLAKIVGEVTIPDNLIYIYMLFLMDTVLSYLLIYKRSMLDANQENYIYQIVHMVYVITMNGIQVGVLLKYNNYYLYLMIKVVVRVLENYTLSKLVDRKYPFIKEKQVLPLDFGIRQDISIKVKAILFHKIGGFAVLGSDNILISVLINVTSVGYYSNYKMIINAVQNLFTQAFSSLTASVGNLLVTDKKKTYEIFRKLEFLNFWLSTITSCCLLIIIDSFIELWLGKKYILSTFTLVMLVMNYYLQTMRAAMGTFKDAAGIFWEDRFIPFAELFCNIIFSIICSKYWGLAGVFMGTVISNFVLHFYSFPKFCYKKIFNDHVVNYFILIFKYFTASILICVFSYIVSVIVTQHIELVLARFVVNIICAICVPNIILYFSYRKTSEFMYFKTFILSVLNRWLKK